LTDTASMVFDSSILGLSADGKINLNFI